MKRSTETVLREEIDAAHALLEKARDRLDKANEAYALADGTVKRMQDELAVARARHDRAEAALGAFLPLPISDVAPAGMADDEPQPVDEIPSVPDGEPVPSSVQRAWNEFGIAADQATEIEGVSDVLPVP